MLRPRVWPALTVVPVTMLVIVAADAAIAVAFAVIYAIGGIREPSEIQSALLSDMRFVVLMLIVNMTIIGTAALAGGALSRERWTARLGLMRPNAPLWSLPLIFIGTGFVWGLAMTLLPMILHEPSEHFVHMTKMFASLGAKSPILLIFLIAVLPAVMEELLLRGYVQRRLVQRWGAVVGVLLATLAFAALHIDPVHALGVIPLGLWCGYVAWRTSSVYPAMLCHGANNGLAVVYLLMHPQFGEILGTEEASERMALGVWDVWPMLPFMGVTGVCLLVSIVVLSRTARRGE